MMVVIAPCFLTMGNEIPHQIFREISYHVTFVNTVNIIDTVNTENTVDTANKLNTLNTLNSVNTINTVNTSELSASLGWLSSIFFSLEGADDLFESVSNWPTDSQG